MRSPFGEIDLVADDGGTLVFVEVKAKRSLDFGFPEEAVGGRKKSKLGRLASWYLSRHPKIRAPLRFDVLAIQMDGPEPAVRLIQNAFELNPRQN